MYISLGKQGDTQLAVATHSTKVYLVLFRFRPYACFGALHENGYWLLYWIIDYARGSQTFFSTFEYASISHVHIMHNVTLVPRSNAIPMRSNLK